MVAYLPGDVPEDRRAKSRDPDALALEEPYGDTENYAVKEEEGEAQDEVVHVVRPLDVLVDDVALLVFFDVGYDGEREADNCGEEPPLQRSGRSAKHPSGC